MSDPSLMPSERRRVLYGRRQGHKLRKGQRALLEQLLPQLAVDLKLAAAPAALFPSKLDDVWLEVGFGGGEHLAKVAESHPSIGFIGCEPFVNGIASLLSHVTQAKLDNIRVFPGDARDLLETLGDRSIGRVFLLYPDPWPKKRHHKRRFISGETLSQIARVLRPGGEFRVATDIPAYCQWTLQHILRLDDFEWCAERPSDWRDQPADWPGTRYEQKAIREGRQPVYLRFLRKG